MGLLLIVSILLVPFALFVWKDAIETILVIVYFTWLSVGLSQAFKRHDSGYDIWENLHWVQKMINWVWAILGMLSALVGIIVTLIWIVETFVPWLGY